MCTKPFPNLPKEIAMSASKEQLVKTLATLATSQQPRDEFAGLLSTQAASPAAQRMQDVLAAKRAKQDEAAIEAAAEEVLLLVSAADININSHRAQLAHMRRQVEQIKDQIETIAVARIYGERTMNWLPLAAALGKVDVMTAVTNIDFCVPAVQYQEILKEVKAAQAAKTAAPKEASPAKQATPRKRTTANAATK